MLQSSEPSLAEALIDPVLERFAETIASVATGRPDLADQCESLTVELRNLLDPPASEPACDSDDADLPF